MSSPYTPDRFRALCEYCGKPVSTSREKGDVSDIIDTRSHSAAASWWHTQCLAADFEARYVERRFRQTDQNAQMTHKLTIQDVGAIKRLDFALPEPGGICVFRGRNASGKSTALRAVEALLTGTAVSLTPRDGAALGGKVEGLGVKLTIGRSNRMTGKLSVRAIEGEDPSALVDPGISDPERADAARIRSLCKLAQVTLDLGVFAEMLGGEPELRSIASVSTLKLGTLPEFTAALKRDLQSAARLVETDRDKALGEYEGLIAASADIPVDGRWDERELAAELERAVSLLAAARANESNAVRRATDAQAAREALGAARTTYVGPSVEQARSEAAKAEETAQELTEALARALEHSAAARESHRLALAHEKAIATWEASVHAAETRIEIPHTVTEAEALLAVSREAVALGSRVRLARDQQARAIGRLNESEKLRVKAARVRATADACEGALTEAISKVAPRGLRVRDGRLVVDTVRGETLFGELSHGERWRIALDIAIDALGEGSVLTVAQEAFESLDPENRAAIAEHARSRKTVILTAEADGEDLRVEEQA